MAIRTDDREIGLGRQADWLIWRQVPKWCQMMSLDVLSAQLPIGRLETEATYLARVTVRFLSKPRKLPISLNAKM